MDEVREREIERRMHPKTASDFEILYKELEAWRVSETQKIEVSVSFRQSSWPLVMLNQGTGFDVLQCKFHLQDLILLQTEVLFLIMNAFERPKFKQQWYS